MKIILIYIIFEKQQNSIIDLMNTDGSLSCHLINRTNKSLFHVRVTAIPFSICC